MIWNLEVQVMGRVSVYERRMGSRQRDWKLELAMVTGDAGARPPNSPWTSSISMNRKLLWKCQYLGTIETC